MARDLPRILVHPGFHKTGTSSAQHLLWKNRARLAPEVDIFQLRHLREVARLCALYARSHNPLSLLDMVEALDTVFADLPENSPRHILISCEGLAGHLPGWPGVTDYGAAPLTVSTLIGYLAERFPGHRPEIVLTTRNADAWLESAWKHHLIGHRLVEVWPDFAGRLAQAADLAAAAESISQAVGPVPVAMLPLETAARHPLGPGGALLDHLPLSEEVRAALVPVGHGNRGPDSALAAELLRLNRSDLPDETLKARKLALCEAAGVGGWARGNV